MTMNLTIMQTAWLIYAACGLGLCLATWWMFLWAWRFVRYSAVITIVTLLFTPYAIDAQTMQMAPAIYSLLFNGMALGLEGILPLIKLMLGIWCIGIILVAVFVLLTRKSGRHYHYSEPAETRAGRSQRTARSPAERSPAGRSQAVRGSALRGEDSRDQDSRRPAPSSKKNIQKKPPAARKDYFPMDNLSREERQARDEMLQGDAPMRAIRD